MVNKRTDFILFWLWGSYVVEWLHEKYFPYVIIARHFAERSPASSSTVFIVMFLYMYFLCQTTREFLYFIFGSEVDI